ncbi:hypothetical protein Tco_0150126 [Tanacetum coccineum]
MLLGETLLEDMDQDSAHIVDASKVPMLKPGEFELWRIRIEQYIQMIVNTVRPYAVYVLKVNAARHKLTTDVES